LQSKHGQRQAIILINSSCFHEFSAKFRRSQSSIGSAPDLLKHGDLSLFMPWSEVKKCGVIYPRQFL
jgi:hypothetical protein